MTVCVFRKEFDDTGMALRDKTKIKEAVIPRLISGVSKVSEQTLLWRSSEIAHAQAHLSLDWRIDQETCSLSMVVCSGRFVILYSCLIHGYCFCLTVTFIKHSMILISGMS